MGRILIPGEVAGLAGSIREANARNKEALGNILPAIAWFEEADGLEGAAWSGIKAQMADYRIVVQGMQGIIDQMDVDCDSLVADCGGERLVEDEISSQIAELEFVANRYSGCIRGLYSLLRNEAYSPWLSFSLHRTISAYEDSVEEVRFSIAALHRKLERLADADLQSSRLFASASGDLAAVQRGLEVLAGAWTGEGFALGREGGWRASLEQSYWRMRNRDILERYLVLDRHGTVVGIRPDGLGKVGELFGRLFGAASSDDIGAVLAGFTDEERYLLAYLAVTYGPEMFGMLSFIGQEAQSAGIPVEEAFGLFSGVIDGGRMGIISELFSFTFYDGKLTALDVPGSLQGRGGFGDIYDYAAGLLGMDLDTSVTVFVYGGKEYRIQSWDGSYGGGLGVGGEIGLYARPLSEASAHPYVKKDLHDYAGRIATLPTDEVNNLFINHDSLTDESDQIPSKITLKDKDGKEVFYNDTREYANEGTHYWNFATKYNEAGYTKEDVYLEAELAFEDDGLRQAAKEALERDGIAVEEKPGGILEVTWA